VFRQFREGYARYVSYILHFWCGKSCSKKDDQGEAFADGLAPRRCRGLEQVELNEQFLMEENYIEQKKRGRGLTGDGTVVMESNVSAYFNKH